MYSMQYGLTTLSLWDGLKDFFDSILGFFEMIGNFFVSMFEGITLTIEWIQTAVPINFLVVNSMPDLIVAACTLVIGIFVLRQIFGFWLGGS